MLPHELITQTRDRGITLRVDGATVKARHLRAEERAALADPAFAQAVVGLLALEAAVTREEQTYEARLRDLVAESAREQADRVARERRERLSEMEPQQVRRLVESGRLSAADVAEWEAGRAERRRRAAHFAGIAAGAALFGQSVRVVDTPDGPMAVATSAGPGFTRYRSTWNGGLYGGGNR